MNIFVNDEMIDLSRYGSFHDRRFDETLEIVRRIGAGRVIEMGGHPWAMTARLLQEPGVELMATVSAEEVTAWPDELPVEEKDYEIKIDGQETLRFTNYSANIERVC